MNSALNCFVEDRFELALKEAKEADELIQSGSKTADQLEKDQPFLGVPFSTKDCLAVKGKQSIVRILKPSSIQNILLVLRFLFIMIAEQFQINN